MMVLNCACPACRLIRVTGALELMKLDEMLSEGDYIWCLAVVVKELERETIGDEQKRRRTN